MLVMRTTENPAGVLVDLTVAHHTKPILKMHQRALSVVDPGRAGPDLGWTALLGTHLVRYPLQPVCFFATAALTSG
jgi:hypothetical protein